MRNKKKKNRKTCNEIIPDLKDPRGWTVENNPYPPDPTIRLYDFNKDGSHWTDFFEWLPDGTRVCHGCIERAKYGSGNCQDNGDYFICLPKEVREGKVPYKKPVRTVQGKLDNWG